MPKLRRTSQVSNSHKKNTNSSNSNAMKNCSNKYPDSSVTKNYN